MTRLDPHTADKRGKNRAGLSGCPPRGDGVISNRACDISVGSDDIQHLEQLGRELNAGVCAVC